MASGIRQLSGTGTPAGEERSGSRIKARPQYGRPARKQGQSPISVFRMCSNASAFSCRHEYAAPVCTGSPRGGRSHRELGPEYGDAVVDSFLEKVEARLDARVDARV